jgi:hypothetical protein
MCGRLSDVIGERSIDTHYDGILEFGCHPWHCTSAVVDQIFIISSCKHPSLKDAYLVHELIFGLKKNIHIMDFIFKIANKWHLVLLKLIFILVMSNICI